MARKRKEWLLDILENELIVTKLPFLEHGMCTRLKSFVCFISVCLKWKLSHVGDLVPIS